MNLQNRLTPPLVGLGSRTGTRGHTNDDYCEFFEVDRGDMTVRLPLGALAANGENGAVRPPLRGYDKVYVGVVADGVTSSAAGAQASRLAVAAVKATLQAPPSRQETISEWLEFAIIRANDEILFEAKRNPEWQGMSTTIVLAALAGEKLYVMHLGDSRAYLVRSDHVYQLTMDHTWAQEAMDAGSITTEEALEHPGRNQLLRFLGAQKSISVDRGLIAPDTWLREEYLLLEPGDAILLCTDGLYRSVRDTDMHQILQEHSDYPQDAVDDLIATAVANGARDDVSAILLEVPPLKREAAHSPATAPPAATDVAPASAQQSSRMWLILLALATLVLTAAAFYQLYFLK